MVQKLLMVHSKASIILKLDPFEIRKFYHCLVVGPSLQEQRITEYDRSTCFQIA
jgi:hypothetical protein